MDMQLLPVLDLDAVFVLETDKVVRLLLQEGDNEKDWFQQTLAGKIVVC
jgi:hypothetical protein